MDLGIHRSNTELSAADPASSHEREAGPVPGQPAIPMQRHPWPLSLQLDTPDDRPNNSLAGGAEIKRVGPKFLLYNMISNWALIMLYIM